jgi:predicted DNA-binding transcriptional regulator AlpA
MSRSNAQQTPAFVSIPEASRLSGIGLPQFRRAISAGDLAAFEVGGWKRVRWSDVVRWIESQRVPVTNHARSRVDEILEREQRTVV